jgi:hypothetical protein
MAGRQDYRAGQQEPHWMWAQINPPAAEDWAIIPFPGKIKKRRFCFQLFSGRRALTAETFLLL